MFREARCLYSGRSLRIASIVVALLIVQTAVASDLIAEVQSVLANPWQGGLDLNIQTTGKPTFATYELGEPARFVIELEQTSLESKELINQFADLKSGFFDSAKVDVLNKGESALLHLEFALRAGVTANAFYIQNGIAVSFSSSGQNIETEACLESNADFSDLAVLLEQNHELDLSASNEESISSLRLMEPGNIISSVPSYEVNLPVTEVYSKQNELTSPVAEMNSRLDSVQNTAGYAASVPTEDVAFLQKPVLDEYAQQDVHQKIDFRDLEEASNFEDIPVLAQLQSSSIAKEGLKTEQPQNEVEYTGAPINLDLKNIDIVEILRIFADLSSMNIIIDPGIKGQVTVKMRDVPWDQAFLVILRNQGLGFTIDGNIVRVATLKKLDAEFRAQAKLRESQMIAEPLSTEIVYLNYATPAQIQKLLKSQMSHRGQILTDTRTNSLIIRDLQQNIAKVKRLVEILDVRTKQIAVNAQIVSASKSFTRDLGIAWNGNLVASPQFGNDTGLSFPNDITTNFGVQLPAGGNGFVGFQFGNLLDTVNLNVVLAASESEGITKTISNPRVVTSDNVSASVRSGQIIPYQSSSISGNVVVATVIFREAAVSLSVTPHVTSDNYVRMKITVSSDSPNFDVATSAGPPIRTNSLTTTVLVKDGDTFVVGGLNSSSEGSNSNKVPFLHRLPVLGNLFKNKRTVNAYTDLLMFITPVVLQDEDIQRKSLVFESYDVKNKDSESPKTP